MSTSLQFALSNPTPGMEEEFNRWYSGEHLTHGVLTPGVLSGQRFQRIEHSSLPSGKHDYLMIWELDDPDFAVGQFGAARGGHKMPLSPAIDMNTVQPPTMWLRASFRSGARIPFDTTSRGSFVLAFVNPLADAEEAFQSNLLKGELCRIADLPNVVCAELYTLGEVQIRGNARKFRYGILVELADEATALPAVSDALNNLAHLDKSQWMAPVFRPLIPKLTRLEASQREDHA